MATPAQVTVNAAETTIYAGGRGRGLIISNNGSNPIVLSINGDTSVTLTNGLPLAVGATYEFSATYYGTNQLPIVKGLATGGSIAGVQVI